MFFERGVGNGLVGNQIPNDVVVYAKGSPTVASVTYIRNEPSIQVKVDAYSSVVFLDENRTVAKPRIAPEHHGTNDAAAVEGERYLQPQHRVHSVAGGTDDTARSIPRAICCAVNLWWAPKDLSIRLAQS